MYIYIESPYLIFFLYFIQCSFSNSTFSLCLDNDNDVCFLCLFGKKYRIKSDLMLFFIVIPNQKSMN